MRTSDEDVINEDFTDAVFADQQWQARSFVGCRVDLCPDSHPNSGPEAGR